MALTGIFPARRKSPFSSKEIKNLDCFKSLQRAVDMSEKVAVSAFIIVVFSAEERPAVVSAVSCACTFYYHRR